MKTLNLFKNACGAALLVLAMALPAFTSCYDDSALNGKLEAVQKEVNQIKTDLTQLKSDLAALQAAVDGELSIVRLNELPDGYELVFSDSTKAVIKNGKASVVGAKEDEDGNLYWTIDGEWLLDKDGNKVKASAEDGQTPDVAIVLNEEDGYYYWQLDGQWLLGSDGNKVRANGLDGKEPVIKTYFSDSAQMWVWEVNGEKLKDEKGEYVSSQGPAGLDGLNGDAFFESVELSGDGTKLIITLLPETEGGKKIVYEIPMGVFDIVFDTASAKGVTSELTKFNYTISGVSAGDEVIVRVLSTNATEYKIVPDPEKANAGYLEVALTDGEGYVDVYVLNNTTGDLKAKSLKLNGQAFFLEEEVSAVHLSPLGQVGEEAVVIPLTSGVEYEVSLSDNGDEWLDMVVEPRTKAVAYDNLVFTVPANETANDRRTTLTISDKENPERVFASIVIEQKNYYSELVGVSFKESWKYTGSEADKDIDSEYTAQSGNWSIGLSDDFSKGAYKVVGFLSYANNQGLGGSATLYADVEENNIIFHGEKNAHSFFGLTLTSDFVCALNDDRTSISKEGVTVIASTLVCKDYSAAIVETGGDDVLAKIAGTYTGTYSTSYGYSASQHADDLVIVLDNGTLSITKLMGTLLDTPMTAVYEDNTLKATGGSCTGWGGALNAFNLNVTIDGNSVTLTPKDTGGDLYAGTSFYSVVGYSYVAVRQ